MPRAAHDTRLRRRWQRARVSLIPLAVLLAITLPHLGQGDFRTDTGWYAAIGLSSVRHLPEATGIADALTLHAEPGKPFFNKPPLPLWIHGVFLHLFGVSLGIARLPTILAACACVALTGAIARSVGTRTQAMAAGLALALTIEFFRRTKEISLDMWQLVFMLAAVWLTVAACRRVAKPGAANGALSGAMIGLALLCKPLVALLASVILMSWLAHTRRLRLGWAAAHLAAALLVASPWYILMAAHHGDAFLTRHFIGEVADRAAGLTTDGAAGKSGGGAAPIWFYASQLLTTYWPWLATTALALIALARREFPPRVRPVAILALAWFVAWFVLLTIFPDRRPRYALVLWPAGAILSGLWLGLAAARPARPLLRAVTAWGTPVAIAAGLVFALLPVRVQRPPNPQWPALFEWMAAHNVNELWQGAFDGPSGARLYLYNGRWPIQTQDRANNVVTQPPQDALLIYHRRDGHAPGPGETILFTHSDLTVTRLDETPWRPIPTPDPGEE